mgnify:CR=1 FL=1
MAWLTPKTDWIPTDIPTASDFNRIEENIYEIGEVISNVSTFGNGRDVKTPTHFDIYYNGKEPGATIEEGSNITATEETAEFEIKKPCVLLLYAAIPTLETVANSVSVYRKFSGSVETEVSIGFIGWGLGGAREQEVLINTIPGTYIVRTTVAPGKEVEAYSLKLLTAYGLNNNNILSYIKE